MNLLPRLFVLLLILVVAKGDLADREEEDASEDAVQWERDLGGDDSLTPTDDFYNDDFYNDDDKPTGNTTSTSTSCFSALSTVEELTKGRLAMKNLNIGDKILTKSGEFQTVFAFAHKEEDAAGRFLQFHSKQLEYPLEVTGEHLIYLHKRANPVKAASVQVGDDLDTTTGPAKIDRVKIIERKGLYAPMTADGTLVVDGVAASNYISFQDDADEVIEIMGIKTGFAYHDYVHMGMSPFRLICLGICSKFADWVDKGTGMPMHVSLGIKTNLWMFQQNAVVQCLVFSIIIIVHTICYLLERIFGPSLAPLAIFMLATLYTLGTKYGKAKKAKTL